MSEEFKSPILVTGILTPSGTQDVNVVSPIPLPVTGTLTPSGTYDVNIVSSITLSTLITNSSLAVTGPLTDTELRATPVPVSVSTSVLVTQGTSPWVVSGTITTSPNINVHDGTGVSISSTGSSLNVDVTNSVPVTGPLTDTQLRATPVPVTIPIPVPVTGTFFQTTQPVSGVGNFTIIQPTGTNLHTTVDNFPATQPVSGTVAVSNFPATQAVTQSTSPWIVSLASTTITGNVTVVQPTGTNLHTVLDSGTLTSITNALPAGSNVIGHVIADSGSTTVVTGNVTVVQPTGTNLHVVVDSAPSTVVTQGTSPWIISGAVTNTPPANQSINLAQLNGITLGSPSNYGTSPGAVEVLGVNAFITNTPAVTLASTTITGTVAVTQSTSPWVVSLASTTLTGTSTVAGNLTNNNAAPIGNNLGVLPALANAANPSWTEGDQVLLSEDLSGNLRVKVNSSLPAGTNVIGHVIADTGSTTAVTGNVTVIQGTGTNLHTVIDSGTLTAVTAITNALPAGSNVIGHVITDSGSTTAVTQTTSPWVENVSQFGGSNVVTGTGASGSGIPRVTVSNDSTIKVWNGTNTLTVNADGSINVNPVPIGTQANAWNAATVASGGNSTVIDAQYARTISIFGNVSGNVNPIRIQASQDNSNFYTIATLSASTGNFGTTLDWGARYIRLQVGQAVTTITATIAGK